MKGKVTTDAVYIMRQMQEETLEGNRKVYYGFLDITGVSREVVYWSLRKKLVKIVMEAYRESKTKVSTFYGDSDWFDIRYMGTQMVGRTLNGDSDYCKMT